MYIYKQKVWQRGKKSSGTLLAEALGIGIITPNLTTTLNGQIIINWGCSSNNFNLSPTLNGVYNTPDAIKIAVNKLKTLSILEEQYLPVPMFTTTKDGAIRLLSEFGGVVCRTLLTSHSGKGIVLARKEEDVVDAKLYTAYYKKLNEYRVHVFRNNSLLVKKRKLSKEKLGRRGIKDTPQFIRNLRHGFIYSTRLDDVSDDLQSTLKSLGMMAIKALGLDFGAVDIMETEDHGLLILEVNTAPGLSNQSTFNFYLENIMELQNTLIYGQTITEPL